MRDDRGERGGLSEVASNAELVARAFERWNAGERESLLEFIDPDMEIRVASTEAFGGRPYRGHAGYWEWVETMEESFEVWQLHPDVFEELGDTVVVLGHLFLRGRGSGIELNQETGWVVEARDGKMLRFEAFLSHAEARVAAGVQ